MTAPTLASHERSRSSGGVEPADGLEPRRPAAAGRRLELAGKLGIAERAQGAVEVLRLVGRPGQPLDLVLEGTSLRRDLAEIAAALGRDQGPRHGLAAFDPGGRLPAGRSRPGPEHADEGERGAGDAGVAEAARDRGVDRHVRVLEVEGDPVPAPLLSYVPERVLAATAVELVQDHEGGEVEHVDLLELAGGAVLGRHHVDRDVDEVDDLGVALPDPGRLHDDEPEPLRAEERDGRAEGGARGHVLAACREGAHEHAFVAQAVDADAVAEERAAGAPARRVDRDEGDRQPGEPLEQAGDDLVGDGALARPAGARDADERHHGAGLVPGGLRLLERLAGKGTVLDRRQHPGDREIVVGARLGHGGGHAGPGGARDEIVDHALEPEREPVVRVVDALDAVRLELLDLGRRDRAAAAAEHADVTGAALSQHVDHVPEVLDVTTLVRAHGDRVGILLDRGAHDLRDAPVVAEMDHLGAAGLDQPPHHVDRRVVAVEERRRRDDAERCHGSLGLEALGLGGQARHPTPSIRNVRVSFSISRAITSRWISCVPS